VSQFVNVRLVGDHRRPLSLVSSLFGRGVASIYRLTAVPSGRLVGSAEMTVWKRASCEHDVEVPINHRPPIHHLLSTRRLQARLSNAATVAISHATPGGGQPYSSRLGLEPESKSKSPPKTAPAKPDTFLEAAPLSSPDLPTLSAARAIELWLAPSIDRAVSLLATTATEVWPSVLTLPTHLPRHGSTIYYYHLNEIETSAEFGI
jgi:hypothetical protein